MEKYTIILRTTSSCNLSCKYCYDKNNNTKMLNSNTEFRKNIDNLVKYISIINSNAEGKARIIFHGGEPTLIKEDTYVEFINKNSSYNVKYIYGMQTNGTLLNEQYIKFLKEYDIHVGISLDGFSEEENKNRVYRNGKQTYSKVIENICRMQKNDNRFGIIITLSKNHIGKEKQIYDFIASNNINCNIRPAFVTKDNESDMMTPNEYYNFFVNLFELWYNDETEKVKLRQIDELYLEYMYALDNNYSNFGCSNNFRCFKYFISLDVYGNVYSCNRTYNNDLFYYGNLNNTKWEDIKEKMDDLHYKRQYAISNSKCKKCEIFNRCKGGCPACAYNKNGDFLKPYDHYCEAMIKIHKYIKKRLQENGDIEQYNKYKKMAEFNN